MFLCIGQKRNSSWFYLIKKNYEKIFFQFIVIPPTEKRNNKIYTKDHLSEKPLLIKINFYSIYQDNYEQHN